MRAVAIFKSENAKTEILERVSVAGLIGDDLEELQEGIEGFWAAKEERNRLIHDRWFPNIYERTVHTRGLTRKKIPQEVFGSRTIDDVWALARTFMAYDDLFSHRAHTLRREREESTSP